MLTQIIPNNQDSHFIVLKTNMLGENTDFINTATQIINLSKAQIYFTSGQIDIISRGLSLVAVMIGNVLIETLKLDITSSQLTLASLQNIQIKIQNVKDFLNTLSQKTFTTNTTSEINAGISLMTLVTNWTTQLLKIGKNITIKYCTSKMYLYTLLIVQILFVSDISSPFPATILSTLDQILSFSNISLYLGQDQISSLLKRVNEIGFTLSAVANKISVIVKTKKIKSIGIMQSVSDQLLGTITFLQNVLASKSNTSNSTQSSQEGSTVSSLVANFTTDFFASGNLTITKNETVDPK